MSLELLRCWTEKQNQSKAMRISSTVHCPKIWSKKRYIRTLQNQKYYNYYYQKDLVLNNWNCNYLNATIRSFGAVVQYILKINLFSILVKRVVWRILVDLDTQ